MNIFNKNLLRRTISIFLLLTLYVGLCFEVAAFPPDVMAVGELHELDVGYSIAVVEADIEREEAGFVLYKEGRAVDETAVSSGERFGLHDGEIFYFEATLDSVFRSEEPIMVHLVNYDWGEPYPSERPLEEPEPAEEIPYGILIISAVTIVLISVIFISIRLKTRVGRQKIEGYKAKMHEWEKEGYDVSELKKVLEEGKNGKK